MKEDTLVAAAACIPCPASLADVVMTAIESDAKWFVLTDEETILGCIQRKVLFEQLQKRGLADLQSLTYEEILMEAVTVHNSDDLDAMLKMNKVVVLLDEAGQIKGVVDWKADEQLRECGLHDKWVLHELQAVFQNFYHSIFVTDGKGTVIKATGQDDVQYIGKNVFDLERERAFYPSVTVKVLQSGKREKCLQYTPSGEVFMIESIPITNEAGEIERIVSITKDTSEMMKLTNQLDELKTLLESYQRERLHPGQIEDKPMIYKSKEMQNLMEMVKSVASVDTSILILGETGVGKQVVANRIHMESHRRDKPFFTVNCGAIPDNLLESELFGYEEGAFSGARKGGKPGIFELADKGTVFLDEIGELPLNLQVKLLHVLQEKTIMRVGGGKAKKIDVRIITATNRKLEKMVENGTFRQDLYYRINIIPIHILPLRERREDISALIYHYLDHFNRKYDRNVHIQVNQLEQLLTYSWPGNVRELENAIERFTVTSQLDSIFQHDKIIALNFIEKEMGNRDAEIPRLLTFLEEVEKMILKKAMAKCKTTREMAACLGVNQSTIVRKIQKYRID
ncbi:Fis family transcriptional regulator [Brevibacillus fluminis]|uniref:HTH-type transcriptional regulatory protein TyrR n=1 Tax=Brevibacillus fluminis TaxID=511487 RepID=A0A3M8DNP2_9BACL|nr:sigma 54-interacting transcriptional regulator [Brevibacillus fluminis]RNB89712.1 Fis family transcriptional regulator [Brevibacillus fluminis]